MLHSSSARVEGAPVVARPDAVEVRGQALADPVAERLARWSGRGAVAYEQMCDRTAPITDRVRGAWTFAHQLDQLFATSKPSGAEPPSAGTASDRRAGRRRLLHELAQRYDAVLHEELVPGLDAAGVHYLSWSELGVDERAQLTAYFDQTMFPLLTPMVVDATHPFPRVPSSALNIAIRVRGARREGGDRFVCVTLPHQIPRVLNLVPGRFVPVESVVNALLPRLFARADVAEQSWFRVTRRARNGDVVRLEVEQGISDYLVGELSARLRIADADVDRQRSSLAMGPTVNPRRHLDTAWPRPPSAEPTGRSGRGVAPHGVHPVRTR